METSHRSERAWRGVLRWSLLGVFAVVLVGCEVDSFFDQSVVGRWERTPVTLPILDRLDVIDEQAGTRLDVTRVQPEDHVPDPREYVIGSGDLITVTIFELIRPGEDAVQTRRIDEVGRFRLPVVGAVRAVNLTPTELERHISEVLEREGVLRNAEVSVIVQEARQNTFSVLGEPAQGGTAVGTYAIPKPDFRLLDALAMARGVPGRTKRLLIYRQSPLSDEVAGRVFPELDDERANGEDRPAPAEPDDPSELIEELLRGEDRDTPQSVNGQPQPERREAPRGMEGPDADDADAPWVHVGGEWVRADSPAARAQTRAGRRQVEGDELAALSELITQRIIEVPYDRLLEGDMRYNIVIRPGDVIRVPAPTAGFVYIMGEINRPGAYVVPGENDLTLKQLIASGGNLGPLAVPERVDLTRRVGTAQEATVRLNLRAIFNGTEPDLFLKPNDIVNVGTAFWAQPLAIFRNGFRVTYGFGFLLDRNFGPDVFD